jgi:hypothetical protein
MTTTCRRCHSAPIVAIGLCRKCGLQQADVERRRRSRAERKQQAASRYERRQRESMRVWQAPAEPEDVTL